MLSFEPYEPDGSPRRFVGLFRPPFESLSHSDREALRPAFAYSLPMNYERDRWLAGDLDRPLYREAGDDEERLRETLIRAAFVAEHLIGMIEPQVWRDHGGDDGQGHYEGDYRAEETAEEIKRWRAIAEGRT